MVQCKICAEIRAMEYQLDIRAQVIIQRVIEFLQPMRKRNNRRWERFARLCHLPLVGDLIQHILVMPKGLETNPAYYNEEWYLTLGRQIEADARKIELRKSAHLEHWGDEIISPMDSSDPGGYYTPSHSSRRDCYAHGLVPFIPDKFDFSSAAGCDKFDKGQLVMCSITKRVVAIADCSWEADSRGVRYRLRTLRTHSRSDPTIPGFGEWRNDEQVFAALEIKRREQLSSI